MLKVSYILDKIEARGWILIIFVISWFFLQLHKESKSFIFPPHKLINDSMSLTLMNFNTDETPISMDVTR